MKKLLVLTALIAGPRLALAATPGLHLLESRTLSFAPFGMPLQAEGVLQEEVPPPPPMPSAPEPGMASSGEQIPSKGKVIALMAAGGGLGVGGVIFIVYGLLEFGLGAAFAAACQQSGGCPGFNPFIAIGVAFEIVGVALEAVGITLLIIGNAARVRRNAMLSAQNVSVSYNPVTRSPMLGYAVHF